MWRGDKEVTTRRVTPPWRIEVYKSIFIDLDWSMEGKDNISVYLIGINTVPSQGVLRNSIIIHQRWLYNLYYILNLNINNIPDLIRYTDQRGPSLEGTPPSRGRSRKYNYFNTTISWWCVQSLPTLTILSPRRPDLDGENK